MVTRFPTGAWVPDILGAGYERRSIDLGVDPDGEGRIEAVLVRRTVRAGDQVDGAVLYVHGFADYFFQTELADFAAARGLAFHALDLRKSGRSRGEGQTAHFVTDLAFYDEELEASVEVISQEHGEVGVVVVAHSTGGLVAPLWLDRRRRAGRTAPVTGLVLNSPWFDLRGSALLRGPGTLALRALARVRPLRPLDLPRSTIYADGLHASVHGEWDFDLALKPLDGFPVTVGWLGAVRAGHAALHRGLDVGVPSLVLRSSRSHFSRTRSELSDRSDTVLDVRQIARWSGCLGGETTVLPIADARHDVFLSRPPARAEAYGRLGSWLEEHLPGR